MDKSNAFYPEGRDHGAQILDIIRNGGTDENIKTLLDEYHDHDIASIFNCLSFEEHEKLLRILGSKAISDIVAHLDDAGEYLSEIAAKEAADIIEEMDADDAFEALDDLDEDTRNVILGLITDAEVKEDLKLIGSYDDEVFGSRMSTNFIVVKRDQTIKGAMSTLISEAAEKDNIYTIFVSDENGSFYGVIDLKDLIVARSDVELKSLIYTTFPYVYDTDKISDNIEYLRGYSEDIIPVISSKNGCMLGVITAKDIIDLVDEELGDDYAKFAALSEEETPDESIFKSLKKRSPWLIVLLFMGLAVSAVVGAFEGVVDALPMIVSFQSLILGMAGNVGTQSLAVTVRYLGTNSEINFKKHLSAILREVKVAFLNGIVLGVVSLVLVSAYMFAFASYGVTFTFACAGCVGLAMCFAMTISGLTGALIPICLHRFGADPAVASGPLITTINDLVAVLSYYGLAWALLLNI